MKVSFSNNTILVTTEVPATRAQVVKDDKGNDVFAFYPSTTGNLTERCFGSNTVVDNKFAYAELAEINDPEAVKKFVRANWKALENVRKYEQSVLAELAAIESAIGAIMTNCVEA